MATILHNAFWGFSNKIGSALLAVPCRIKNSPKVYALLPGFIHGAL
jgi:hypothetical protein